MGDMADEALERMMDVDQLTQDDDWQRSNDRDGYWSPFARGDGTRYIGSGPCPRCGSQTILRHGPHGRFWGCSRFPKCRGSRDWED